MDSLDSCFDPVTLPQLAETASWDERFALVTAFLMRQYAQRAADAEVAATWHRLMAGKGLVSVTELAAGCGWSRKRLWSRFTAQIGVTPKHACRVVRFRRVFEMLVAGQSAAEAAIACGYADQSHLRREVSGFVGMTPGVVARNPQEPECTTAWEHSFKTGMWCVDDS
ncbi:helix-turn-helix domain-containing protein [Nocardia sp. IFM 10818]